MYRVSVTFKNGESVDSGIAKLANAVLAATAISAGETTVKRIDIFYRANIIATYVNGEQI